MKERMEELEKELEKVCKYYDTDCGKCPKQAECEEYCKLYGKSKKPLNSMCERCKCLGKSCKGTACQVWTGCINREI